MNRIAFLSFFVVTALLGRAAERTAPSPPAASPAPAGASAATAPEVLKLADGRVLTGWRIVDESPEYVTVRHKAGISKVSKKILPEPVRSAYPIDKEAAAAQRAADEAARKEREAKALSLQLLEEKARQEQKARAVEAGPQTVAVNAAATEADQRAMYQRVFAAAKVRADRYFNFEFEPSGTSRILSINVAVDADDPEPWPGIPGRYTVKGKGYLEYYSRIHTGFDHATKEWIAYVDVTPMSAKVVDFRLR